MVAAQDRVTIRYARTADGVNLAYVAEGAGPAVIVLPFHFSHVRYRWISEPGWANGLVGRQRVVTYDSRGQGLSDRDLANAPTMDDYRADLEAVWDAAGVESAVLVAYGGFAHVALRYAMENPRVTGLVLVCASSSFAAWPTLSMVSMAKENWDLFLDLSTAKADEGFRPTLAAFMKACAEADDFVDLVNAFADSDVTDCLSRVLVPTLVIHSLDQHWLSPDEAVQFASKIPCSQVVLLDGDSEPNVVLGVKAIQQFLDTLEPPRSRENVRREGFADTGLTERQLQVLNLITQGRTNREVAATLFLSERTIERHLGDIYGKLGVRNRAEAIACALRHG